MTRGKALLILASALFVALGWIISPQPALAQKSESLQSDVNIGGIPYKRGTIITYHQDGSVASGTLREEVTFGGVTYKEGTQISFYPKIFTIGNMKIFVNSGVLAKDTSFPNGKYYRAGTRVYFDKNGFVR